MLTVAQAAALLHVGDDTVRRTIARGELAAIRIASLYRIDPQQLADWLEARFSGSQRGDHE